MKRVTVTLTTASKRKNVGRAVQDVRVNGLVKSVKSQRDDLVGVDRSVGAPKLLRVPCRTNRMRNMCNMGFADEVISAPGVDEPAVDTPRLGRSNRSEGSACQVVGNVMGRIGKEDGVWKVMQGLKVDLCRDLTQMII